MAKVYAPTKISENISETPEGYLLCKNVPIARTGVMVYGEGETPLDTGDDGKVYVDRDADEVFDPKTIASAEGKSLTIKHPNEFINPKNWSLLSKGILRNVRRGDEEDEDGNEQLLADLLITEAFAISLVRSGLREVSCGYEAEYEQTGKGKGRQTNIVINHLALVEEGRAGSSYAINDHKGKGFMSKKILESLKEKIAGLTRVVDEAAKANDDQPAPKAVKSAGSETNTVMDEEMYDELVQAVKDLSEKVEGMKGGKSEDDEEDMPPKKKKKEESEDDEDMDLDKQILERLKVVEAACAKLLAGKSEDDDEGEEEESEDESEEEESEDEEYCEDEEGEEGEESQKKKTGDAVRAEILAPGLKASKKQDLKEMALRAAYKTKEGKEVLDSLTGEKKLTLDSKSKTQTLFVAASEILKAKRGTGLEGSKDGKGFESFDSKTEVMTAEKMNELNAAHWARK